MKFLCRFTGSLILIFSLFLNLVNPVFLGAQEVYPCIWRNPERTMVKIFPQAKDYRTMSAKISREKLAVIEKKLGSKLLPGQREQFQYHELIDSSGTLLGWIIPSAQKGEYGAIEFVFGLDRQNKVNGVYVQRSRERDKEFKKEEFLSQFAGKSVSDGEGLAAGIKAVKTKGTESVIQGFRKELIAFNELFLAP